MGKPHRRGIVIIIVALISLGLVSWAFASIFYHQKDAGNNQPLAVNTKSNVDQHNQGPVKSQTEPAPDSQPQEPETANAGNNNTNGTGQNAASTAPESTPAPAPAPEVSAPSAAEPKADLIWSLPVNKRAVFITVDDGWTPSWPLLTIMQQKHLPVTAFLTEQAVLEHPDYWQDFIAAGGDIENHTYSHPYLTHLTATEIKSEISRPADYYRSLGANPVLLRPPYGAYNDTVRQVAYSTGIKHLVMWNAVMEKGQLETYNSQPVQPGAIILLHFTPDFDTQLTKLLTILQQQNLGVADLPTVLNSPDNFNVTWLDNASTTVPGGHHTLPGAETNGTTDTSNTAAPNPTTSNAEQDTTSAPTSPTAPAPGQTTKADVPDTTPASTSAAAQLPAGQSNEKSQ